MNFKLAEEAFGFKNSMVAYAYAIVKDWAAAEDVVQDSYIVVIEKQAKFKEGTSLTQWVKRIVFLKCMERLRKNKKLTLVGDESLEALISRIIESKSSENDMSIQEMKINALKDCMKKFKIEIIKVIHAFYWEKTSIREIANQMEISENTIRLRLLKYRKSLKTCVTKKLKSMTD
ncbi:MAG: hypothetical protein COA79_14595 [Planctomycetota bacterium]|nr:MAG: hypothetical protein COA79_14595 [Planctomycetota bacterium]